MEAGLRVHQGGRGEPVLLLLHGLGATGDVWQGWRPLLAPAPVTLARGEHDAMNTYGQLARLGVPVVTLPGLSHNAHVQNPQQSIILLDPYR